MENENKINTYNKKTTASQQVVGEVGRKMNNWTHLYDQIYHNCTNYCPSFEG